MRQQKRLEPLVAFILRLSPEQRFRIISYTTTTLLHLIVFGFISQYSVFLAPQYRGGSAEGGIISVSIYTLAGSDAVTDAPLNEPLLAETDSEDGTVGAETDAADAGGDSASDADGDGDGGDDNTETGSDDLPDGEPDAPEDEPEAPVEEDREVTVEDPVDSPEVTDEIIEPSEDLPILTAPDSNNDPISTSQPVTASQREDDYIPAPVIRRGNDLPIATTQQVPTSRVDRLPQPTFAEIEARTDQTLRPEDYVIQASSIGSLQTVLDSFCLSSSDTLLQIADCPEGPNPNQISLADYAMMEFGEVPPVFMEDMDRLAFQLEQLGADASTLQRLLIAYQEALRAARARDPVLRTMERDRREDVDNLGVSNPFDLDQAGPGGE